MKEPTRDEITRGAKLEALWAAADLLCTYCARHSNSDQDEGVAMKNEKGVLVHRTFSSRGLASDHECRAAALHMLMDEVEAEG